MVTKFKYYINEKGLVARTQEYSFTAIEELSGRLAGIDNVKVIDSIANATLQGEAERDLIALEDNWFKTQTQIQDMDTERKALESKLINGDRSGNPLTPEVQSSIKGRIAELKEGTITVEKEFYDHYTRKTHKVKEVVQTPYTIALEARADLEANNNYLKGFRGVKTSTTRPTPSLTNEKETAIRKELVRQQIATQVGDMPDLLADVSNALAALIKQVNGQSVTNADTDAINKYVSRQGEVAAILKSDYTK